MTKTKAAYARFSSSSQTESSIEVQIEACEKTLGGPARHFIDRAKTGRSQAGRDGLSQLMDEARAGRISTLCVWRFSRLGRNLAESATTIQELEDLGVKVISSMEGSDPLSRSIFLAMAEHYSRELAQNTRGGLLKSFQNREHTGGEPAYGYKVITDAQGKKRIAIDEVEIVAVKYVLDTFRQGILGYKGIARECQAKGYPTRRGQRWGMASIRGILNNPIVTGTMNYNRRHMKLVRKTGRRVHRDNEVASHLSYHDPALQIITPEAWQEIQARFEAKRNPDRPALPERLRRAWTGLLKCGSCGNAYYSRKSSNSKGEYIYYNCGYRQRMGQDVCPNSVSLREDKLLADFQTSTRYVFDHLDKVMDRITAEVVEQMKDGDATADRINAEIADLERKNKLLMALVIDPEFDGMAKKSVGKEIGANESRIDELHRSMSGMATRDRQDKGKLVVAIRESIEEARQKMENIDTPAELNELLSGLVGVLVVGADGSLSPDAQSAPVLAGAGVTDYIAGARYTALHIQTVFRDAFLSVRRAA